MLSGDNGILQKATEAKTQTGVGQEKETIALAYNSALAKKVSNGNSSAVTDSELNDELDSSEATASGSPIIVTFIKSGNAYEIDSNGIIKESTPRDPNASNLTAAELAAIEANNTINPTDQIEEITSSVTNTNLQDTTKIKAVLTGYVPIPVGANYIEGTVDTGVVIEYKGSQFVWVPVPNAVYESSKDDQLPKSTTTGSLTNGHSYTPMAIEVNGNYKGLLYEYINNDSTNGAYLKYPNATKYQGTDRLEPALLSDLDIDDLELLKANSYNNNLTKTYLEEIGLNEITFSNELTTQYNAMVSSVAKYGGFFIGRYETSISENTVASISGVAPMNASTNNQRWYGMYDKLKKFCGIDPLTGELNGDKLQSSMIWGSQYDAMFNWALKGSDKIKVNSTTGNANYNYSKPQNTGAEPRDVINNIYDIEGNEGEYTLEAEGSNGRSARGSFYNYYACAPSSRVSYCPYFTYDNQGSRLTLYIK